MQTQEETPVWINKGDDSITTLNDLIVQLGCAIEEKDKPGIRPLKGMIEEMGGREIHPEYFYKGKK